MTIQRFVELVHGPLGARRGATNQALDEIMARQASRLPLELQPKRSGSLITGTAAPSRRSVTSPGTRNGSRSMGARYERLSDVMEELHNEACWADAPTFKQAPWVKLSAYELKIIAFEIADRLGGSHSMAKYLICKDEGPTVDDEGNPYSDRLLWPVKDLPPGDYRVSVETHTVNVYPIKPVAWSLPAEALKGDRGVELRRRWRTPTSWCSGLTGPLICAGPFDYNDGDAWGTFRGLIGNALQDYDAWFMLGQLDCDILVIDVLGNWRATVINNNVRSVRLYRMVHA